MKSIDRTLVTVALALSAMVGAAGAARAETEEEKNYYLEQMKQASRGKQPEPGLEAVPSDNGDLIADDVQDLSSDTDNDYSSIGEVKPRLDKPSLDFE